MVDGPNSEIAERGTLVRVGSLLQTQGYIQHLNHFRNIVAREDDILMISFPRSGVHWLGEIVDSLLNKGNLEMISRLPLEYKVIQVEPFDGPTYPQILGYMQHGQPSPRLIRTHLPPSYLPEQLLHVPKKKILITRDPRSVIVSLYHFYGFCTILPERPTFEKFFEDFMKGDVYGGSWFDFSNDWSGLIKKHNILPVSYEELKKNPHDEIRRIAAFLEVPLSKEELMITVSHVDFRSMKENSLTNFRTQTSFLDFDKSEFIRKGEVYEWKEYLTEEMLKEIELKKK